MSDQEIVEDVTGRLIATRLNGLQVNERRGFPEIDVEDGPYGVYIGGVSLVVRVRNRLAYVTRIA